MAVTSVHTIPGPPKEGDLVEFRLSHVSNNTGKALVLEYHSSNIYEPAYVKVLDNDDIFFVRVRDCTVISMAEDGDRLEISQD